MKHANMNVDTHVHCFFSSIFDVDSGMHVYKCVDIGSNHGLERYGNADTLTHQS